MAKQFDKNRKTIFYNKIKKSAKQNTSVACPIKITKISFFCKNNKIEKDSMTMTSFEVTQNVMQNVSRSVELNPQKHNMSNTKIWII